MEYCLVCAQKCAKGYNYEEKIGNCLNAGDDFDRHGMFGRECRETECRQ